MNDRGYGKKLKFLHVNGCTLVANDLMFRMCLLIMIAHKLKAACIELETAFLHGVLSQNILENYRRI